jgi:hypothetical protein
MDIENGLSSLLFITVPLMFELPYSLIYGFVALSISSILFHIFPDIDLFRIMDTSSIIYVCSCYSISNEHPFYPIILVLINIAEKMYFGTNSAIILMCVWVYSFIYCTIKKNMLTLVPILFSSLFYHYTYILNNGRWNKNVRLLWHYYNTLYICINTPYVYKQYPELDFDSIMLKIKN